MSNNVKVKLDRAGVRKLLKSDEMQAICNEFAYRATSKLGDGYSVTYRKGKNRVNAEIAAVSAEAKRENMETNSILKAVGSL